MRKPIKVLEIIYRADRGGAETWLLNALRHIDRRQIAMDFLVHDRTPGAYDAEIAARGARIFVCRGHRNPWRQLYGLWRLQRRHGVYDVVHSHVDYYGGLVMLYAWLLRMPARIAHSHNDTRTADCVARLPRRCYVRLMKVLVRRFSTRGLATSASAAGLMFGEDWSADPRWGVIPACVDLSAFRKGLDRARIRAEIGIPESATIFGHVGRFVEQKNHAFFIHVAEKLAARERNARFLLIGGGSLQQQIENAIRDRGLRDRFIVLSPRDDIPRLMLGAMDFFLFPSLHEGLGLALVEAQAAGLRCFASHAVPPEAIVVPELVHRLPLSAGPEHWAQTIVRHIGVPNPVSREDALRRAEGTFDTRKNAARLVEFYQAASS